jgi:hypothetical protein
MMTELYTSFGGATDPSVTTVTTSGAATVGTTLDVTGAATFGSTVAATGKITGGSLALDTGTKTASATAGAATLNKDAGVITSEALTTAAGATYTLTLTNSSVAAADQVFASVRYGTASAGMPVVTMVTPSSGAVEVIVQNIHASAALDGTIKIAFAVLKN